MYTCVYVCVSVYVCRCRCVYVGLAKAPIRGNTPTRPIYTTTAQIGTKVFVYPCCHIAYERKH